MNKLTLLILLALTGTSLAQSTKYTVSYDGVPACNTTFTISDTNKRVLGSGKSDLTGTFECNYDVEGIGVFMLKSTPDKGKGWELRVPFEAIEAAGADYDIPLENVEAMMKEAFDMQNEMLGDAGEKNDEMNRQSGSNAGSEELGMIGGIVKAGQTVGDAQFKLIRASIGKSCSDAAAPAIKKPTEDKKVNESVKSADDKKVSEAIRPTEETKPAKTEDKKVEKVQEKPIKEESTVSKKDLKAQEEAELEKAKEAEKEAARLEKERKEKERKEKERLDAEAEAAAEDLNFTPEEFAQMSFVDLNKKQAYCETAILRNKMKLSTRAAFMKEDEKTAIENRIKELETAVASIEAELARRKAEEEAKKAAKAAEKNKTE